MGENKEEEMNRLSTTYQLTTKPIKVFALSKQKETILFQFKICISIIFYKRFIIRYDRHFVH